MTWRFIRVNALRIVVVVFLVAAAYWAISVHSTYQREQRIGRNIQALGGRVEFKHYGPNWISQSIRDRIRFFERIWSVDMTGQVISTDLHSELSSLTNLVFLNLNNTQVTDADLERLMRLTKLRELYLFKTQVTDAGVEHIQRFTNLTDLGLANTKVSDFGLEHLKGLTNLKTLDLHVTKVTDAGVEHLRGLTNMTYLFLNGTRVTDAGLEHLKGLTSLSKLNIRYTHTTPEGRAMLQKALPICEIEPKP